MDNREQHNCLFSEFMNSPPKSSDGGSGAHEMGSHDADGETEALRD